MAKAFEDLVVLSAAADVDEVLIHEDATGLEKRITKGAFLAEVSDIEITGGVTWPSATVLGDVWLGSVSLTVGDITAGSTATVTATLSGIATTDFLCLAFTEALPTGLVAQWWISAADTVSVKFVNTTAGTITGASYTGRCGVLKAG